MYEKKFEYFLSVVETGSITKAAEKNYIAQSSMSQFINRLEESFGVQLFDRKKTPLQLTEAGTVFFEYVQKYMELDRHLEEAFNKLKATISGTVVAGIPLQMQVLSAYRLIPYFSETYPNITVSLRDEPSPALEKAVQSGRINCALIFIQRPTYEKLDYTPLGKYGICIVCSQEHPIVAGRYSTQSHPLSVQLSDLSNARFLLMDQGFIVRTIADSLFEENHFTPQKVFSMSNMDALIQTASSSHSIAIVPGYVVSNSRYRDQIAYLEVEDQPLNMTLALVSPKPNLLDPITKLFVDFIKKGGADSDYQSLNDTSVK